MSEKGPDDVAQDFYIEILTRRGDLAGIAIRLERESDHVVKSVARRLAGSNQADKAPAIQAIIDRRLHDEQIAASRDLEKSMKGVGATLERVEALQHRVEMVGIGVAFVGTVLAGLQLWAALRTDPAPVVIIEDRTAPVRTTEGAVKSKGASDSAIDARPIEPHN